MGKVTRQIKQKFSGLKHKIGNFSITEFDQAKFDAATAWMRRTKAGVVILNVFSIEVLAIVSVLKKIKSKFGSSPFATSVESNDQPTLTIRPKKQDSVRVLMIAESTIPQCLHYRVKQKLEQFEACGFYIEFYDWSDIPMLQQALYRFDMVLFYRVPGYPAILSLIEHAKKLRKIVLYDIDDLIFDRQKLSDVFQNTTEQLNDKDIQGILNGADLYRDAIKASHYGIASTPALQQQLSPLVKQGHCFLLANGLDQTIESIALKPVIQNETESKEGEEKVRIFYGSGTKTHDEDFALVAEAISKVLSRFSNVELVLIGELTVPEALTAYSKQIQKLPLMDFESYLQCLQHSDISIAPLVEGTFADCKSEIKWLEAACFAVPSVVSKTSLYEDVINHEKTGYLASTSEEWLQHLTLLVADV